MHLKSTLVAAIVSAAAAAAAMRSCVPSLPAGETRPPAVAFAASKPERPPGASGGDDAAAAADKYGELRAPLRARLPGAGRVVYVAGAVGKPGVYTLAATARIVDALRAAGGAAAGADLVAIDLAQPVEDGAEIVVPLRGAEAVRAAETAAGFDAPRKTAKNGRRRKRHRHRRMPTEEAPGTLADAPLEPVDLNAADAATLATLPGIGPSLAARLAAYRDLNGPFASTDELLDVGGMTPAKVDAISPYVRL